MAKYTRYDERNKKRNKHKNFSKEGRQVKFHKVSKT